MAARDQGQASVELLAVLPALVACVLIAAQAVGAGWAYWSAANAARAGARADLVGADAQRVAREALPSVLRADSSVEAAGRVSVRVRVPAVVPGLSLPFVAASSGLDGG